MRNSISGAEQNSLENKGNFVEEVARRIPVKGEYDVIVSGSGPSGVSAALRAAGLGMKTLLIEQNGCLGGMWTSGLLGWMIDHHKPESRLMNRYKRELQLRGSAGSPPCSGSFAFEPECMKLLLEDLCRETGVNVRLYTQVSGAIRNADGTMDCVLTESKSGREAWRGTIFIDATGDGDLGSAAGCSFETGDPENGHFQPMSMLAILTGIRLQDVIQYVNGYTPRAQAVNNLHDLLTANGAEPTYHDATLFFLSDELFLLMANHECQMSGCDADDLTRATMLARREIHQQIAALRRSGPEWKNLSIAATSERIGVREGRRLRGLYQVTLQDLLEGRTQPDSICRVAAGIDIHALTHSYANGFFEHQHKSLPYDIPLRALISSEIPNLLLTGRCISGDFFAHASYRVTGNIVPLGEAAGILAALTVREKKAAADVPWQLLKENL